MDKLSAMRAFVEIADRGSLTAAGKALGRSGPTMVRTLAALERSLGTRLMRRTTRRIALTDEGRAYLDRCRQILLDVEEAEAALGQGSEQEPTGGLRVTAPVGFGHLHVAPALAAFCERHPRVAVDLILLDRVVNLVEEGFDLAVRIGALPDSALIAAPVGLMRRVVVASPPLLERDGIPDHPEALAKRPCIRFRGLDGGLAWRFRDPNRGHDLRVEVEGAFSTNHAGSAALACVAGLGFGQLLAYQVEPYLGDGRLVTVLEPFERTAAPVSLVYTESRLMTSRLRACVDDLKVALRNALHDPAH